MLPTAARPVVSATLFAAAYLGAMVLGRATRLTGSDTALIWPAAAVVVIWLLQARTRRSAALAAVVVLVLTVLTNHQTGAPWSLSVGFAAVNLTTGVLVAAALRWRGHEPRLRGPRDLYWLLGAVAAGNTVAAAVGAQVLAWRGASWLEAFVDFGTRNGISVLVGVAAWLSLAEVLRGGRTRLQPVSAAHRLEASGLLGFSALVFVAVFLVDDGRPLSYLLIVVSVFVSLRLSTSTAVLHTVVLGSAVVASTMADRGVFTDGDPQARALLAQGLVGCLLLVSLTIALFRDARSRLVADLDAANRATLSANEQLRHVALYDSLTGLANRVLLVENLTQALAVSHRTARTVGVLFLDLDGFKPINDEHGHAAGDEVLAEVARRLQATARPGDSVSRLGGDEFVVVCPDLRSAAELDLVARRHAAAVAAPLSLRDGRAVLGLTASIGQAVSTLGSTPDRLLSAADHAMYEAKRAARAASGLAVVDDEGGTGAAQK